MTTRSESTACFGTGIGELIRITTTTGLREAMRQRLPLIYFHGIVEGKYEADYPVFVVGDSPESLTFTVSVDERAFDAHLMTVRPVQGFHGQRIDIPIRAILRPNPSLLEARYELFRRSADSPRDGL